MLKAERGGVKSDYRLHGSTWDERQRRARPGALVTVKTWKTVEHLRVFWYNITKITLVELQCFFYFANNFDSVSPQPQHLVLTPARRLGARGVAMRVDRCDR